jgi:hypothetical protein
MIDKKVLPVGIILKTKFQPGASGTCNPSYSGGKDQEDRGTKPAGQIVSETLS